MDKFAGHFSVSSVYQHSVIFVSHNPCVDIILGFEHNDLGSIHEEHMPCLVVMAEIISTIIGTDLFRKEANMLSMDLFASLYSCRCYIVLVSS